MAGPGLPRDASAGMGRLGRYGHGADLGGGGSTRHWQVETVNELRAIPMAHIPGVRGQGEYWGQFRSKAERVLRWAHPQALAGTNEKQMNQMAQDPVKVSEFSVAGRSWYSVIDGQHRLAAYEGMGLQWVIARVTDRVSLDVSDPWGDTSQFHKEWMQWMLGLGEAFGFRDDVYDREVLVDPDRGHPWALLPVEQVWVIAQNLRCQRQYSTRISGGAPRLPRSMPGPLQEQSSFQEWVDSVRRQGYPHPVRRAFNLFRGAGVDDEDDLKSLIVSGRAERFRMQAEVSLGGQA